MIYKKIILFWITFQVLTEFTNGKHGKRSIVYPLRSLYGVRISHFNKPFRVIRVQRFFVAIALPVDLPDLNVFISYNFESNYYLPYNTSELGDMAFLAPITEVRRKRQLNRRITYKVLEKKLESLGFPGRSCLLRTICEASESDLNVNGVLGTILQVLLKPSSSEDERLSIAYYRAERLGEYGDCSDYTKVCPESLLDIISKVL